MSINQDKNVTKKHNHLILQNPKRLITSIHISRKAGRVEFDGIDFTSTRNIRERLEEETLFITGAHLKASKPKSPELISGITSCPIVYFQNYICAKEYDIQLEKITIEKRSLFTMDGKYCSKILSINVCNRGVLTIINGKFFNAFVKISGNSALFGSNCGFDSLIASVTDTSIIKNIIVRKEAYVMAEEDGEIDLFVDTECYIKPIELGNGRITLIGK